MMTEQAEFMLVACKRNPILSCVVEAIHFHNPSKEAICMPKLHISTLMNEIVRTNAIEEIRMWYMFSAISELPQPALVHLVPLLVRRKLVKTIG